MTRAAEKRISIHAQDKVFILTGAGISAESGLATFRDANGLWHGHRPEDVATPEAWAQDAGMVWEFYSDRRRRAAEVEPNPAHLALADLEQQLGDHLFLCTQNVDNLHEKAGSQGVVHMHGQLFQSRCEFCDRAPFNDGRTYFEVAHIPRCACGGRIRPHVCWFGEMPYDLDLIMERLEHCTVFATIGSSGLVQPAATFPMWAGRKTARGRSRCYYVGLEQPANVSLFDEVFLGKAATLVPEVFGTAG
jgi:NAD-dependent deacetylase